MGKYIREFSRLSRYAADEVNTDAKRVKRFLRGLDPYAAMQLKMTKPQTLQELMNSTITWENDYKLVQLNRIKRAKTETKKFQPSKSVPNRSFKPRVQTGGAPVNRGTFNPKGRIICHGCGLPGHVKSECRKPKVICFGCGQEEHVKSDCPNKSAGVGFNKGGSKLGGGSGFSAGAGSSGKNNNGKRGRTFGKLNCTSLEEADNSETVVLGRLSILTHYGKVLFDTVSTTSFLSSHFVEKYGIRCAPLDYPLTVVTAGGTLLVTQVKPEQIITICNYPYYADLYILPLKNIEVVLGMDWMSEHGAQIDCEEKTVSIKKTWRLKNYLPSRQAFSC